MRKLNGDEVHAIAEALGYYSEGRDGAYVTSGQITGPKGFWLGPLDNDEYLTVDELKDFLVERLELLESDVDEALRAVVGR